MGRGWVVEGRLPDPGDPLTGVEIFAALEPEARQRVIAAAVPRTYRKGQLLFVENDPPSKGDRRRLEEFRAQEAGPVGNTLIDEFKDGELDRDGADRAELVLPCERPQPEAHAITGEARLAIGKFAEAAEPLRAAAVRVKAAQGGLRVYTTLNRQFQDAA